MTHRRRLLCGVVAGLFVTAGATSAALGAVQVVELSAQRVLPGTVVTLRVATTSSVVGGAPGQLFMIPHGTWGDSPDSLRCEEVGGAIVVGQIHWQIGTVEYQGTTYDGFEGEATFSVPSVAAPYPYWLAESIDATGTGCHVFSSLEVVTDLPDTAMRISSSRDLWLAGGILAIGTAGSLLGGWRRTRRGVGQT